MSVIAAMMNVLITFIAFFAHTKASLWDDLTVAVVDYSPILDSRLSDEERIVINANQHVQYIGVESVKNVDLIVFPESTLTVNKTTAVELIPTDNPCFNDSSYPFYPIFVRDLSCAARAASSYVVVNLVQKVRCRIFDHGENCKTHGYLFYNTDVVFGRYGEIDSLYHKYSLFGETELDRPQPCDDVIVFVENTNFGIFTGFDIFFKNPTRCLSRYSLDGIIFPSVWFSELPFLTALQTQQMWSHAHNITLLAAGAKNPSLGSGGSGIYRGVEDPISLEISAEAGSTILPSDEKERDTDELAEEMDGFHLGIDPDIAAYNSTILDTWKNIFNARVCYHRLCCDFTTNITILGINTPMDSYTYHLVAYSGVRNFSESYKAGIEVCAIIACLNSSVSTCGRRFPNYNAIEWPLRFEKITIKTTFEDNENRTQYPNSLLSSIRPIKVTQTIWKKEEVEVDGRKLIERTFALAEPQDRILTFAIYGRNFDLDETPDDNSGKALGISWYLLTCAIVLSVFATK